MNMNIFLVLIVLLLIRVIDKIIAKLFYFKALDVGVLSAGSIEGFFQNNDFGFLLGFWNVLWWIALIICFVGSAVAIFLFQYILK